MEGMVVLDRVTKMKDGESRTFFGVIGMAICGKMCFDEPHDERLVRAWAVDEERNDENPGGTSRPFVLSRKFALLARLPPLPRGCFISYYVLGSPDRWCFPRIFGAGVVGGILGYRSNLSWCVVEWWGLSHLVDRAC